MKPFDSNSANFYVSACNSLEPLCESAIRNQQEKGKIT